MEIKLILYSNQVYNTLKAVYLPDANIESYEDLPENWRIYKKPTKNAVPTCYEIPISGTMKGVKGNQDHCVTVNKRCYKLMEMLK